jgi:hypothetical protein
MNDDGGGREGVDVVSARQKCTRAEQETADTVMRWRWRRNIETRDDGSEDNATTGNMTYYTLGLVARADNAYGPNY